MAHITVEVATHLDLAAKAKAGPQCKKRPDASEFVKDDGIEVPPHRIRAEGCVEDDDTMPAGPGADAVGADEPLARPKKYLYEVSEAEVDKVAMHELIGVASSLRHYRDHFLHTYGHSHHPRRSSFTRLPAGGIADFHPLVPPCNDGFAAASARQAADINWKCEHICIASASAAAE